jgi:anti-sigma factor ChrR (cupin superfamily)
MSAVPSAEYVDVAALPWEERRPGVFWKVLSRDGEHQTILVRYAPGATVPRHRHLGEEQIFVLEGSVADDTGVCHAGNFARRPPGCTHTVHSANGALVLAVISGTTEPAPDDSGAGSF